MHPLPPSPSRPAPGARGASRAALALLAALMFGALAAAQPPKEPDKKEPETKEPEKKEPTKAPEPRWPTEINGKDIKAVMRDMEDPDPTAREFAAKMLPGFGPPAQKGEVSKLLLRRMVAEKDPGVRFAVWGAVGEIAFDSEADNKEAIRILAQIIDTAQSGGPSRYQAVQTITRFGYKGEPAVTALTGTAMTDVSYETRRVIAHSLGRVGGNESTGPNMKALTALADRLARDESAAVRMEALQSLLYLGPPWAEVKKPGDKTPPAIKTESAAVIIKYMKARVGDPKHKVVGLEKDRQVEIWARLVLMRFDPKEVNEDNLEAFARHLTNPDVGVRVQALQAIAIMGEAGARKLEAVAGLLREKDQPLQLTIAAVQVLEAMGGGAKGALPELRKFVTEIRKEGEKIGGSKPAEKLTAGELQNKKNNEALITLVEKAIKSIEDAKGTTTFQPDPPKK
ncbi:HEAT repeat domain-containing protein [Gemmata sp. JC717]|uniref:HEAT repeat domain-containing protein n=1 Tax=Gemmata algarum TaxID=2975278 RepID=UPI0021BB5A2B|nr:HEAT repeat domain-containing protein [Gemmata algarum]MDY3552553.1 HEAT repeat domain-containing protein [Gemmata algarum]